VLCSDLMIEGVHFDLAFATPEDVGHKALAACLSDVAAMNGRAVAILVSLAVPSIASRDFVEGFYRGAREAAAAHGCDVVGGDLSSSPSGIFVDVACFGETDHAIRRSGAKAGDLVAVSGPLGASAAGLHALKSDLETTAALRRAHLRPRPRLDLVGTSDFAIACTSLIDVSDGLSSELDHLANASNVGFAIDAAKIPLHADAIELVGYERAFAWALAGGEDYELLATFLPSAALPSGFSVIGVVTSEGLTLVQPDGSRIPIVPRGYEHFTT
ncbi:MAG: thiamine-phosphate kinase, partial [Bdellovibrionota bacterium]